jgi:predicted YcjX-like family ATPase
MVAFEGGRSGWVDAQQDKGLPFPSPSTRAPSASSFSEEIVRGRPDPGAGGDPFEVDPEGRVALLVPSLAVMPVSGHNGFLRMGILDKLPILTTLAGDRTLRIAVTGLSRSGKTVFITSLVHNLLNAVGRPARLPFLRAAAERRILGARLLAPKADDLPSFPLDDTVAALAADLPHWPASTTDLRRMRLLLRFSTAGFLRAAGLLRGDAQLTVEILDYPGEWLLDLPLLQQSYSDWSRGMLALARRGVRAPLARDWLDFLARHPADRAVDADTASRAHGLYRDFLAACRDREQLSLLQPGRFLNPGQIVDISVLQFCPMPLAIGARAQSRSLAALMEARFDAYKRTVVQPFFAQLARNVERQIVLVDVLRALNAGEEAFADQRLALDTILSAFRFGRRSLLSRLFGARIDRVLFAATKADHVPALQRDHLEALTSNLVEAPTLRARAAHAQVAATALASIRCTEDATDVIDGRKVDVVVGLPEGGERRIRFFPGIVPVTPPPSGFWGERFTEFPVFQPPRITGAADNGIPHVNLDKALDFLLENALE